jgi:hypothetical protein
VPSTAKPATIMVSPSLVKPAPSLNYMRELNVTDSNYNENRNMCRSTIKRGRKFLAREITKRMVQDFILEQAKLSHSSANYDLALLKAMFGYGVANKVVEKNPVLGILKLPINKKAKYIPPAKDIEKRTTRDLLA